MEPIQSIPLHDRIREMMETGQPAALHDVLVDAESFDLANAFFYFNSDEQYRMLRAMGEEPAADLLPMLHEPMLKRLLEEIPQEHLRDLMEWMEPDDAAHVVSCMEQGRANALLGILEPDVRKDLVNVLSYRERSAGRIMDPDVVRVRLDHTVREALESIRRYVAQVQLDEFYTVYVVNGGGVLVGSVPNWKMLLALPGQQIREIMDSEIVSAPAEMDQEQVGRLVRDHDLVSLPVVDHRRRLIGRVTVDDVVDVIEEEFSEDVAQFAGTGREEVADYSVRSTIRHRSPWLLFALIGLFGSAMILNRFQGVFAAVPALAFFVPLVMAMGGNSGLQSASLVIRGLATGEVELRHFWWRVSRETVASVCIGAMFAAVLLGAVSLLTGDWRLGLTVGLSTTSGVTVASVVGTAIPMVLKRFGLDPALATGPFLTTFNDIVGVLVYLGVAMLVMF